MTAGDAALAAAPAKRPATTIPRILHFTWRTPDIPARYRPFFDGWARHHPGWAVRLWTDADLRDFVARHDPGFLPIFDAYPDPIERVDTGRYLVLAHLGGVFVDLDLECFQPIDALLDGESLVLGLEPDSHGEALKATRRGITRIPCPTFMASTPGHAFWSDVRAALPIARRAADPLDVSGPFLLSRVLARYRGSDPVRVLPSETLYPVDRDSAWEGALFDIERWNAVALRAYTHHHWDGSWFRTVGDAHFGAPARAAALVRRPDRPGAGRTLLFRGSPPPIDPAEGFVSCLMVTGGRAPLAAVAIRCFQAQTWAARELVIVDDDPDPALAETVRRLGDPAIRHIRLPPEGRTLGELRNLAIDAARGPFVCQWDDDDLYDPLRIEYQMRALAMTGTDACFLLRWLQWMPAEPAVSVSTRRLWEGSLLGRKTAVGRYPGLRRGEDTPVAQAIVASVPTVHLDLPRLYLYVGHQRNTHDPSHHRHLLEVATARFPPQRTAAILHELARRLPIPAYEQALDALAALPPPSKPPPVRPLADIAAEAHQAMRDRRHEDALHGWEEILRHGDDFTAAIGRGEALSRLRRINAAIAQFRDVARRYRRSAEGPARLGQVLLAIDRPEDARKAFEEALRRNPGHAMSLIELGIIDLKAGRLDAAEPRFLRAIERAPAERRGWMGAAAVAVRRHDWPLALERWRAVWERFRDPTAPQEIAGALLAMGHLREAWDFLEALPADALPARERLFGFAWLAKLAHDGRRLLAELEAARPQAIADDVLRRMLIEALTLNGRAAEAAAIVAEAGIGSTPTSQMFSIHALVAGGREDLATHHLRRLGQPPALLRTAARLLPDILAQARRDDGPAGVRRVLEALAGSAGSPRELRLAGLFERECADSLDALFGGAPLPAPVERRPLAVPAAAEDIPPGWASDPMDRAWTAIERVRERHGTVRLDLRVNLSEALAVADRIAAAIADRTPLSVLRLGDGEGNFLPYAADLAAHQGQDQRSIQRLWWSDRMLDRDATAHLMGLLADAVRAADIVGIPDQYRLANSLGRAMRPGQTSRGLMAVVEQFAGLAPAPPAGAVAGPGATITSCHLHSALAWWGLWDVVLGRAGTGAVVTGRSDLGPALERRFGFHVARTHRVPAERKYVRDGAGRAEGDHYPDGLERVCRELAAEVRPGQVVLVAAGILGKVYCAHVRAAGGIALDVGSAADHWCGHVTRTRDEAACYQPPPGLAAAYAGRPDLDRLYPALAPSAFFHGKG
ncbi:glycosyltransferase [Stella sp.]|uniref:glycosyltransferase n=1 Tax=Stella sp. TaxID=2912054 RepID=UPI0035B30F4B